MATLSQRGLPLGMSIFLKAAEITLIADSATRSGRSKRSSQSLWTSTLAFPPMLSSRPMQESDAIKETERIAPGGVRLRVQLTLRVPGKNFTGGGIPILIHDLPLQAFLKAILQMFGVRFKQGCLWVLNSIRKTTLSS